MRNDQHEKLKGIVEALVQEKFYTPMKEKEMAHFLGVPKAEKSAFSEILSELVAEGRIGISVHGKYGRKENFTQVGIFHRNPRGFGFVSLEGRERDVFIPEKDTGNAMNEDEVHVLIVRESRKDASAEGKITRILKRHTSQVVGIYRKNREYGFVIPDDPRLTSDIFIPKGKDLRAVTGHKVVCTITGYEKNGSSSEGIITEILGHVSDPGVDILSVVRSHQLPEEFPKEVMQEVAAVPEEPSAEEIERRRAHDYRALPTITIDSEDAKDLDDAISLEYDEEKRQYTLYVHIADVSYYVQEHSLLNEEALHRGTSVYLVDRVIPMLPRALSNGICSLNEGTDRLTMSCRMLFSEKGELLDSEIAESVIRSDKRMSYHAVHAILSGEELMNNESLESYRPYQRLLEQMHALSLLLRQKREKRGGIDFDFPEAKILLDKNGKVRDILPAERQESNQIIEDFMLAANECVAESIFWQHLPFLYRVHEAPDNEKWEKLSLMVSGFGHHLRVRDPENIRPRELQKLLKKIEGRPEEPVLKTMALRSMKQARYETECLGHFGLAAKYYTHFTSPIRRYPDLQIHRILHELLSHELTDAREAHYQKLLPEVAKESSRLERRAEDAERDCNRLKECEYMLSHLHEEFDGIISGMTGYGIYVELPNTIEGMISLRSMKRDHFIFNEAGMEIRGERSGRSFRLGEPVHIRVANVDKLTRTIDFLLCEAPEEAF